MIKEHGKKWSVLGKYLRRTENTIKNRFHSMIGKLKEEDNYSSSLFNQCPSCSEVSKVEVEQSPVFPSLAFISEPLILKFANFKPLQAKVCGYRLLDTS